MTEEQIKSTPVNDVFSWNEITDILGKGSYAHVYLAKNKLNGLKFAIKHYTRSRTNSTMEADMRVEMKIMSNLHHPNIVELIDAFINDEQCYLVFELCTGGELFEDIVANKYFSETKCKVIIKQIMEAVHYLHCNGVIHRDIKPENILYETSKEDALLKITDFGVSKLFDSTKPDTKFSSFIASKYYVAPEILIRPSSYTKEVDCWSVGVIAHILLVGYPPYDGKNIAEVYLKIRDQNLTFLKRNWSKRSKESLAFIKELLQRDAIKRMKSVKALQHTWLSDIFLQKYSTVHLLGSHITLESQSYSTVNTENHEFPKPSKSSEDP